MQILNIAGYKFVSISDTNALRQHLLDQCLSLNLKGTILLSQEGINISLAGHVQDITDFENNIKTDSRFASMHFRQSYSLKQPFKRLKIKIKKEIIHLGKPEVNAVTARAPSITPKLFKQWLDENRDLIVLDTRNDYEIKFGTFKNAINLALKHFKDFPSSLPSLQHEKPIVMFCTGGIRCEKAALYMLQHGFTQVYQLEGGILNYFAEVGSAHFRGECFVFDERISLDANLEENI